jgi:mannose-6-phosphate isomerase-like protein (cupin superfamily)
VTTSENRPWGSWHVLDEGDGFKVKRIVVNPSSRLSLQKHQFRAEHWVVVAGTATCTVGGETVTLHPGDTVDVEIGEQHRIANLGDETLVIIEVQRGSYTGEDDIVRLEDDYGRSELSRAKS